jgi:hypothetical protein
MSVVKAAIETFTCAWPVPPSVEWLLEHPPSVASVAATASVKILLKHDDMVCPLFAGDEATKRSRNETRSAVRRPNALP